MASPFPSASIELDYPLYAVSFDPHNANRLVVGGGGGASRTGVGNKITVLETDAPDQLRIAGELELSRDEDSVMSLAFGASQDDKAAKSPVLFAGVNSSPDDMLKGSNLHLRCFSLEHSKARAAAGARAPEAVIAEVSRNAFFEKPDADTYQRLLRTAGKLGAAASGMGKEPQLAVFDACAPKPRLRGLMELPRDAEDLDVIQSSGNMDEEDQEGKEGKGEDEYLVAFCYKHELYMVKVGKEKSDPELIFTMPDDHGVRPAFRSIRFLSPGFLLAVSNLPGRSGALIHGFRMPTPKHDQARVSASVRIPGNVSATSLAVANVHPATPVGDTQFIIAVATNDCSIHLYTVDYLTFPTIQLLSHMYPLCTLKNVHNGDSITGVAFSTFHPPPTSATADATATATSGPSPRHHIKLASITLQKNVAVHSIPLRRQTDTTPGKPSHTRYVTAMRARPPSNRSLVIVLSVIVLIMAILGQSILELYGWSQPVVHVHRFLPGMYGSLRDPTHPPAYLMSQDHFLSKIAAGGAGSGSSGFGGDDGDVMKPRDGETLVLWEAEHLDPAAEAAGNKIQLGVHSEEVHGPAKSWEELSAEQKKAWREKLHDAGVWTQHMGESVFKGILFSELAGAVGRAVAG